MNKIYILLLLSLIALTSRAESNKGLTDTNNYVEERTTTLFDDFWYKTRQYGLCAEPDDPYAAFNTMIVGTWYENQSNKITFNADGTTDYGMGYTYKFIPLQGTILMYNSEGTLTNQIYVMKMSGDTMVLRESGNNEMKVYTNFFPPVKYVTSITNIPSFIRIDPGHSYTLKPEVFPKVADNKEIIWISSDENIVQVLQSNGYIYKISPGIATITGTAVDGGGASVTCTVLNDEHEEVDLGLSVNWATLNIGASEKWLAGDYFAWGETEPASESKQIFSWETYKWAEGTTNEDPKMTKYCDRAKWGIVDNKMVLDPEDDAAHVLWGNDWRMPTYEEVKELMDNCEIKLSNINGSNSTECIKVTSKINGKWIYLPYSMHYGFTGPVSGENGARQTYFWSSSYAPRENIRPSAYCFYYRDYVARFLYEGVMLGYPIRPVRPNPNYKK